jgi:Protein of unknown function (DUF3443)
MNTYTRAWAGGFSGCLAALLAACGGSPDTGSIDSIIMPPTPVANALPVVIDAGPAGLTSQNIIAANTLYASVTICTPGSATACQTIDHVQVDTGSVGLRIIQEAMSGVAVPTPLADPATANPLFECEQFADGYTWGSVGAVDVTIGGRKLSAMAINVVGDPAAGTAPTSCVSGPPENTVVAFGANGVLGIGNFLQDCGVACASVIEPATYYICPGGVCSGTILPVANQVQNPVSLFSTDNNGVLISLPAVASPGATSVTGTLYFGVATQADNGLGAATLYTLDAVGTFVTNFEGINQSNSFLDTGSNGYFFPTSTIALCTDFTQFYCPTSGTTPVSVAETATIQGGNGAQAQINFTVDNTDTLFAIVNDTVYPNLAGPYGAVNGSSGFDWGLPFFLGHNVYVLFENQTVAGTTGPAVAF